MPKANKVHYLKIKLQVKGLYDRKLEIFFRSPFKIVNAHFGAYYKKQQQLTLMWLDSP